jgi:Ni,Fe-hydrogenase I small subunit
MMRFDRIALSGFPVMADSPFSLRCSSPSGSALAEIDVLWITAGLSCDGDSIGMTAATQPSLEDLVCGTFPWIPKVKLHNPFLSYQNGEEFLPPFRLASEGKLRPFILVIGGSIPNEKNKEEGYWASFGTDQTTGPPILTVDWIDRLAPNAWAVLAAGTCATYGGIHAMEGNPTGCMGLPDHLGWKWKSQAGITLVCVPGCPVQPDNATETLLYLLNMAAGRAPIGDRQPHTFSAQVRLTSDMLRAYGEFSLLQSNFGIKPVSVAAGMLKLKDELKVSFDVVARKQA